MIKPRFVLDTNVLISAALSENSVPSAALQKAEASGIVLYSYATLAELSRVLSRDKFSKYITSEEIDGLLARIHRTWEIVNIMHQVRVCRDPKDDMFLELAVNGGAETLITGDKDLLALTRYGEFEIITPAIFVEK